MAISIPDRVVVFDYGEVISRSPSPTAQLELAALAGVEPVAFRVAWNRHRDAFDEGRVSAIGYWRALERDLGASWSLSRIQELWARDFTSWWDIETGVVDLIGELHEGGTRLALLSNAPRDYGTPYRFSPFGELMEHVFVSSELDLVKPDPEIYRRMLAGIGVSAEAAVFIDNRLDNVETARSLGIVGHHFTSVADLRAFLEGLAA